jgi:hypothetical protein
MWTWLCSALFWVHVGVAFHWPYSCLATERRKTSNGNFWLRGALVPEKTSNVSILQPGRYSDDELRLRCAPGILLPAGMDPTMTREEQEKIAQKERLQTVEAKSDLDILKDELKRMLDSM